MRKAGIWLVAVALAGCGGGGGGSSTPMNPSPSPGGSSATVNIDGDAYRPGGSANFAPGSLNVTVGTTVNWMNNDQTAHTVTAVNGSFNSGSIGGGGGFGRVFSTVGTFEYRCTLHPGMEGQVTVRQ